MKQKMRAWLHQAKFLGKAAVKKIKEGIRRIIFYFRNFGQRIKHKLIKIPSKKVMFRTYLVIVILLVGILFYWVFWQPTASPGEYQVEEEVDREEVTLGDDLFDRLDDDGPFRGSENDDDIESPSLDELQNLDEQEAPAPVETRNEEEDSEKSEEAETEDKSETDDESATDTEADNDEIETVSKAEIPPGSWPVEGKILAEHEEIYQVNNQFRFHNGIDIQAPTGELVVSSWNGKVTEIKSDPRLGLQIIISHAGYDTLYGNLEKALVSEGDQVSAGDEIAEVGTSASVDASEGSFLHFEIHLGNRKLDPREMLEK